MEVFQSTNWPFIPTAHPVYSRNKHDAKMFMIIIHIRFSRFLSLSAGLAAYYAAAAASGYPFAAAAAAAAAASVASGATPPTPLLPHLNEFWGNFQHPNVNPLAQGRNDPFGFNTG